MQIPQKKLEKIIQDFYNEMVKSKEFRELVQKQTDAQEQGIEIDQQLVDESFDFLDKELQQKIRRYLKKEEDKNAKRARNVTNDDSTK